MPQVQRAPRPGVLRRGRGPRARAPSRIRAGGPWGRACLRPPCPAPLPRAPLGGRPEAGRVFSNIESAPPPGLSPAAAHPRTPRCGVSGCEPRLRLRSEQSSVCSELTWALVPASGPLRAVSPPGTRFLRVSGRPAPCHVQPVLAGGLLGVAGTDHAPTAGWGGHPTPFRALAPSGSPSEVRWEL